MKILFPFLLVCIITNNLFSQPKDYKFYIYASGGIGQMNTIYENISTRHGRYGGEYRFIPYIGVSLGISHSQIHEKIKFAGRMDMIYSGNKELWVPTLMFNYFNNNGDLQNTLDFTQLIKNSYYFIPSSYIYNIHTLDVGLKFYPLKGGFFDPYIGIGVGTGNCGSGESCSITKLSEKIGIQFNFGKFFTYAQIEAQSARFQFSDQSESFTGTDKLGLLGVGIRF